LYDALLLQDKINLKKMPHYQGDQDWRNLPVSTIMTFDPVVVPADMTVADTLGQIDEKRNRHHAYPVTEGDFLKGMITHHELEEVVRIEPEKAVADLIQGQKLVTLEPESSIREVARVLVMEDVMQAPVVSAKDARKILGIITLHDIARQQNAIDDSIGR
jgi:CIC family chloride channel protein